MSVLISVFPILLISALVCGKHLHVPQSPIEITFGNEVLKTRKIQLEMNDECRNLNVLKQENEAITDIDPNGNCIQVYRDDACLRHSVQLEDHDSASALRTEVKEFWGSVGPCVDGDPSDVEIKDNSGEDALTASNNPQPAGADNCNRLDMGDGGSFMWVNSSSSSCVTVFSDGNCTIEKDVEKFDRAVIHTYKKQWIPGYDFRFALNGTEKEISLPGIPHSELVESQTVDICQNPQKWWDSKSIALGITFGIIGGIVGCCGILFILDRCKSKCRRH